MPLSLLDPEAVSGALSIRDLTDPAAGPHAMQLLLDEAVSALCGAWGCGVIVRRQSPVVTV